MASPIEWVDFPLKEKPIKGIFALLFIIFITAVVFLFWSKFLGIVSFIVLFFSVVPFYTPTRYVVDEKGISIKNMGMERKKKWEEIKRIYIVRNGIFLSPFDYETRLEHYRGIMVRVYGEKKREVIEFLKKIPLEVVEQVKRE